MIVHAAGDRGQADAHRHPLANPGPGTDVTVSRLRQGTETNQGHRSEEVRKVAGGSQFLDPAHVLTAFDNLLSTDVEIKALSARAEGREVMQNIDYDLERPQKTLVLARLTRDRELNEKLYLMLSQKYEETRIAEAGKSASVQIIDPAKPATRPISRTRR
jgi:hypothetical protein